MRPSYPWSPQGQHKPKARRSRSSASSPRVPAPRRSRPSRAAPATGGTSTTRGSAPGAISANCDVIMDSSSGFRDSRMPPPRATGAPEVGTPIRFMAATAITRISSACRSRTPRATGSPASATAISTGVTLRTSSWLIWSACRAAATSATEARPKCSGTAVVSAVSGPRPSSPRMPWKMASRPRSPPPPQSPLCFPQDWYRATWPSGPTATQLMPAPHTTPAPQRGSPRSPRIPARSTANVSFMATAVCDQPWMVSAAVSAVSSSGRSAPARQADVCRATGPRSQEPRETPACSASSDTISPSRRIAPSIPWASWLAPGPRSDASTDPSSATRASAVLEFPPSMARTAGVTPTAGSRRSRPAAGRSSSRRPGTARPEGARAAPRRPVPGPRAARRRRRVPHTPTCAR